MKLLSWYQTVTFNRLLSQCGISSFTSALRWSHLVEQKQFVGSKWGKVSWLMISCCVFVTTVCFTSFYCGFTHELLLTSVSSSSTTISRKHTVFLGVSCYCYLPSSRGTMFMIYDAAVGLIRTRQKTCREINSQVRFCSGSGPAHAHHHCCWRHKWRNVPGVPWKYRRLTEWNAPVD